MLPCRRWAVQIIYVYQDPEQAWNFVKARELQEGRRIPPERFVHQFFASRDVVNELKVKFGPAIKIDVVLKNIDGTNRLFHANVDSLNHVAPLKSSKEEVEKIVHS